MNYQPITLDERITRIQNSLSTHALTEQLSVLAADYQFEFFHLCLSLRRGLQQTELMILTKTPEPWCADFSLNTGIQDDPIFHKTQQQTSPFVWSKLTATQDEPLMTYWVSAGMEQGVAFPLHGPNGFNGYFTLSRKQGAPIPAQTVFQIMCLTQFILEQAIKLFSTQKTGFSSREKECLFWVSEGKTSWEIAQILGITERTVNFHLNNAIRKSGCKNRYQTVAKSIITGELAHTMSRVNIRHIAQSAM